MSAGSAPVNFVPDEFEETLRRSLPGEDECHETLLRAMSHSLLGGGKRLRPRLVMAAAELGNGDTAAVAMAAAAMEMLHCYSLIHDDLPILDNDDWRRGKPSCHKVFGEPMALLAGDALQALAFETLTAALTKADLPPDLTLHAMREFAWSAGPLNLVGGQAGDIEAEAAGGGDLDLIKWIHQRKTAALIRCSLVLGACFGRLDREEIDSLARVGRLLGLAFQAVDDLLDRNSTFEELGKTPGKDKEQGKLTLLGLIGEEETEALVADYYRQALTHLPPHLPGEALRQLASQLIYRKN
jgi:geranylgeranyl diphosphate synthase, type II